MSFDLARDSPQAAAPAAFVSALTRALPGETDRRDLYPGGL